MKIWVAAWIKKSCLEPLEKPREIFRLQRTFPPTPGTGCLVLWNWTVRLGVGFFWGGLGMGLAKSVRGTWQKLCFFSSWQGKKLNSWEAKTEIYSCLGLVLGYMGVSLEPGAEWEPDQPLDSDSIACTGVLLGLVLGMPRVPGPTPVAPASGAKGLSKVKQPKDPGSFARVRHGAPGSVLEAQSFYWKLKVASHLKAWRTIKFQGPQPTAAAEEGDSDSDVVISGHRLKGWHSCVHAQKKAWEIA